MNGETKQYLRNVDFQDNPKEPEISEQGRKDSIIVYPNEVVRVIAKYDGPGKYTWHCHVLIHEDHDMMRPMEVVEELQ
ncbi:multicopper oxidase domain-containing protein [Nodularia sp. NIES-3585]|uniref:multicopper oxidase domain-containing protein n=1 Tax=Nodularia sp. NIES-3585 TaxID=1973477 RepID=UPI000B6F870F|nr:multicopper oxidase domain-containing protein [Nodularia sp. NIES-3585]GAX34181.1 multicopper oxidase type 2 [Nodularia sp. NIES-3585]